MTRTAPLPNCTVAFVCTWDSCVRFLFVLFFLFPAAQPIQARCRCSRSNPDECLSQLRDIIFELSLEKSKKRVCIKSVREQLIGLDVDSNSPEFAMQLSHARSSLALVEGSYKHFVQAHYIYIETSLVQNDIYIQPKWDFAIPSGWLKAADDHGLGLYHEHFGNYRFALDHFSAFLENQETRNFFELHQNVLKHLIFLNSSLGDHEQAAIFCKERLRITQEAHPDDHFVLGECLNDLAMIRVAQGQYDLVDVYLDSSLALRNLLPEEGKHGPIGNAWDSKGTFYIQQKKYDAALSCFEEALHHLGHQKRLLYNPDIAICHANIAECHRGKNDHDASVRHYEESLKWLDRLSGKHFAYSSKIYLNLAGLYCELGRHALTRKYLGLARKDRDAQGYTNPEYEAQLSLISLRTDCHTDTTESNANNYLLQLDSLSQHYLKDVTPPATLMDIQRERLRALQKHPFSDKIEHSILKDALRLDSVVQRRVLGLSGSAAIQESMNYRAFIADLFAHFEARELNHSSGKTLVYLLESSKNALIKKYCFEHSMVSENFSGRDSLRLLLSEIASMEIRLNTLTLAPEGALRLRMRFLELQDVRNEMMSRDFTEPNYSELDEQVCRYHYFNHDNMLFWIRFEDGNYTIRRIPKESGWEFELKSFLSAIANDDPVRFGESSFKLRGLLLGEELPFRIQIYPDGWIEALPFEALLYSHQQGADFWNMDYCLHRVQFEYPGFNHAQHTPGKSVLIADEEISGTAKEVRALRQLGNMSRLQSKAEFVDEAAHGGKTQILHISSHGKHHPVNPLAGHLLIPSAGRKDTLHGYELLNLPLQGNLATIAACESGQGMRLDNSEYITLSSLFQAAGFSSTITSLWQANDHATSEILSEFYIGIGNGMTMESALLQARKQFVQDHKTSHASPRFWAHLKLTGAGGTIESGSRRNWPLAFLFLVIPIYFIARKRLRA